MQIDNTSTANKIKGTFIGLTFSGNFTPGNGIDGISISGGATKNVIGGTIAAARNVISGNGDDGLDISETGTTGNIVRGNFIGTNAAGTGAIGNGDDGVSIADGASNNVIGATVAGSRNMISGNQNGVVISGVSTTGNSVLGNYIGTDKSGTVALESAAFGVFLTVTSSNPIGGTSPAARNIISGNVMTGVYVNGGSENTIQGNYIGTDKTGSLDLGNGEAGVYADSASGTVIGGVTSGAGNVISGNELSGVSLVGGANNTRIRGNRIGVAALSSAPLGNGQEGVVLIHSLDDLFENFIGGTTAGAGNVIAHNGLSGISVRAGTSNAIQRNRIFDNGGLGIDLELGAGVTSNDLNDAGANDLLNFPVVASAVLIPAGLRVTGSINTELNKSLRIEFFASAAPDASNHGEGDKYLGFVLVQTLAGNTTNFTKTLSSSGVLPGQYVTATVTDQAGNTSEFSLALLVT